MAKVTSPVDSPVGASSERPTGEPTGKLSKPFEEHLKYFSRVPCMAFHMSVLPHVGMHSKLVELPNISCPWAARDPVMTDTPAHAPHTYKQPGIKSDMLGKPRRQRELPFIKSKHDHEEQKCQLQGANLDLNSNRVRLKTKVRYVQTYVCTVTA